MPPTAWEGEEPCTAASWTTCCSDAQHTLLRQFAFALPIHPILFPTKCVYFPPNTRLVNPSGACLLTRSACLVITTYPLLSMPEITNSPCCYLSTKSSNFSASASGTRVLSGPASPQATWAWPDSCRPFRSSMPLGPFEPGHSSYCAVELFHHNKCSYGISKGPGSNSNENFVFKVGDPFACPLKGPRKRQPKGPRKGQLLTRQIYRWGTAKLLWSPLLVWICEAAIDSKTWSLFSSYGSALVVAMKIPDFFPYLTL